MGAQAASLDIDAAFRNIPIYPAHKPFIVVQRNPGEFYMDHVFPFGIASGPGVQGQPMDALVDLLVARFKDPNAKWVDDLFQLRFPICGYSPETWEYAFDIPDIFAFTQPLGGPWKLGKCFGFAFWAIYLGFLWDLLIRTVSLPEQK